MRCFSILLACLTLGSLLGAVPATADDEAGPVTITVLGARVQPVKPKGKPWDADHGSVPLLVWHQLGGATGFPPLAMLSAVPYRNRPDPYVVVEARERELGRSKPVQGSFGPAWLLEVQLPSGDELPPILTLRVADDDLKDDDAIGKALVDTRALLATTGLHTVEGTGGLFDVVLVVRDPSRATGPARTLRIRGIRVEAKAMRPAGGDWDAGGNPLRRRFPRLKVPESLEGLPVVRPDLRVTARWSSGATRTSGLQADALELDWTGIDWAVEGLPGVGDGLYLEVVDEDLALADPVGVVYVPFGAFVEHAEDGVVEVEGDDLNGVAAVRITFALE